MITDQQNYLVAFANLSTKIPAGDSSVTTDVATINSFISSLTTAPIAGVDPQDLLSQIYNTLRGIVNSITGTNKSLFNQVVNGITGLPDPAYLSKTVDFNLLDTSNKSDVESFVTSSLAETTTYTPPDDFFVYQRLIFLAIITQKSSLIEQTITKIQSL